MHSIRPRIVRSWKIRRAGAYFLGEHMTKLQKLCRYFSKGELILWFSSILLIVSSFFIWGGTDYVTLVASLLGATALLLNAKGNPLGQILIIIFSVLYGIVSWTCAYYGEMLTYLGMTAPMAVIAFISWIKNPYGENKAEVKVNRIKKKEIGFMLLATAAVTTVFYFLLAALNTANLVPSTVSVATSFLAMYLTFRRSPYFALAYAANDVVLIVLWILAALENISYLSVIICFVTFLFYDFYGFFSWLRMEKRQRQNT